MLSHSVLYGGVTLAISASMKPMLKRETRKWEGCCHGIRSLTLQLCTSCCWAAGFLLDEAACWAAAMVWVAAAAACLAAFWQKKEMVIYVRYKSWASVNSTCANWMHAWSLSAHLSTDQNWLRILKIMLTSTRQTSWCDLHLHYI